MITIEKKLLALLCVLCIGAAYAPVSEAKTRLSIATGGEAGVYYPLGQGLAKLLTGRLADAEVTAKVSGASVDNVNMIAAREAELALVQNDVAFNAANGEKPFREPAGNLSMIASLYPEQVQCFTIRGNGPQTLYGLRGKRVSVGAPGSGTNSVVHAILSAAGIRYAEVNADFLGFADTALRLQDGQLDAGFVLAGYPTPAITALGEKTALDLVTFDDALLDKLSDSYPFFTKDVIPAGTYPGIDHDTPTAALMAVLVCDSALPDDLVYGITEAIFENLAELAPAHPKAAAIALDKALSAATIKIHPGAVRYYEEKGLEVPKIR